MNLLGRTGFAEPSSITVAEAAAAADGGGGGGGWTGATAGNADGGCGTFTLTFNLMTDGGFLSGACAAAAAGPSSGAGGKEGSCAAPVAAG